MKNFYLLFTLFIFIIIGNASVKAANFVVTSNVDGTENDGVSLRWAVAQAVFNTGPDTITFNIPGPAPHTISLLSDLPQIIGYDAQGTVIDGSTQPANGYTGISPKIIVDGTGACMNGFDIEIPDCEVYGMVITRFQSNGILLTEDFTNSTAGSNFVIGAPGRGNVIYNMDTTSSPFVNGISIGGSLYNSVHNGVIQSNKIGTDTSGMKSFPMYQGIYLYSAIFDTTSNILIGGSGAGQGNLIAVQGGHQGTNIYVFESHLITFKGNIVGADINGNKIWGNPAVTGIYLYVNADSCTIGGTLPGEGNIIAYNEDTTSHNGVGIEIESSDHDMIRRNSVYCNGQWGSIEMIGGNVCNGCFLSYAPPVFTTADTSGASGTAAPKDVIELFYNNTGCTHPAHNCSGETYIGTVTADNSGNWTYTGHLTGGSMITGTATSLDSLRTSAFADCFTVYLAPPPPIASFNATKTTFCQGNCIIFKNLSQNSNQYQWIFDGGSPHATSYIDSINVCYDTAGVFDVTLIAFNDSGLSDTAYIHNYVTVYAAPPTPNISQYHDTLLCSFDPSYTAYQWYMDTTAIPGATNQFLVITGGGDFSVRVYNEDGCSLATGINIPLGLSQLTISSSDYIISPNPVINNLIISKSDYKNAESSVITIYNLLGEVVMEENNKSDSYIMINMQNVEAGTYFIQIQNSTGKWTGKCIKQ